MDPLTRRTLEGLFSELATHPWGKAQLSELVEPRLGVITGFQDLLQELESLRTTDLGAIGPAQGVQRRDRAE